MLARTSLIALAALLAPLTVPLTGHSFEEEPGDPLRAERVDRLDESWLLSNPPWIEGGTFGARPLDAAFVTPPWRLLIVEFDITKVGSDSLVPDLLDLFEDYDERLRVLMVDASELGLDELEWRVWQAGWGDAPVAWAATSPHEVDGDTPTCAWMDCGKDFTTGNVTFRTNETEVRWEVAGTDLERLKTALDEEFERMDDLRHVPEEFAEAWSSVDFDDLEEALEDWDHDLDHKLGWDDDWGDSWSGHWQAEERYAHALTQRRVDVELMLLAGRTVEAEELIPSLFGRVLEKKDHKKRGYWVTHLGMTADAYKDGKKLASLLKPARKKGLGAVKEKLEQFVERATDSTPKMRAERYLRLIRQFDRG